MTGPKVSKNKKTRRSHSFGGCGTCRRRHVKCDQVRPVCLTCRALGVTCEGYRNDLKWVSAPKDDGAKSARRQLYSEKSRVSMSTVLQSDFALKSIDESLLELDARSKDVSNPSNRNMAVGPFGVLDFASEASLPEAQLMPPPSDDYNNEGLNTSPHTIESMDSLDNLNDFLNWSDLFELDFTGQDLMFYDPSNTSASMFLESTKDPDSILRASSNTVALIQDPNAENNAVPSRSDRPTISMDIQPSDAQMLLKHFRDIVIGHMFALPTKQKDPWNILNLGAAVQTLADVTYLGVQVTSHAAYANMLAIIALSACHLAARTSLQANTASHWSLLGTTTIEKAKKHLQWSLQTEVQGPNRAKYKAQLMAIKSMLAYAILFDHQNDARCYMIDAERLLRLRGLAKRTISRKCRLLHHVYTWIRIVGETTYVLRDYQKSGFQNITGNQPNSTRKRQGEDQCQNMTADNQVGHNPRLDDFLRLERSTPESDAEATGQKEHDTGLHDIHLEDSRDWPEGMYMQLYGISETWLSLVSQTTRLANVMDSISISRTTKDSDVKLIDSLERRKERLENMVCSFAATNKPFHASTSAANSMGDNTSQLNPRQNMVRALNSALVIFFYRRIRNVNPWILQEHVNNVIQALKDLDDSLEAHNLEGPGSPWPAFIAGCEAISKLQKQYFVSWMDRALEKTGFPRFKTMKNVMLEVWDRRDKQQGEKSKQDRRKDWTWIHISKEKNIYLMLS